MVFPLRPGRTFRWSRLRGQVPRDSVVPRWAPQCVVQGSLQVAEEAPKADWPWFHALGQHSRKAIAASVRWLQLIGVQALPGPSISVGLSMGKAQKNLLQFHISFTHCRAQDLPLYEILRLLRISAAYQHPHEIDRVHNK
mgnify:CR=1 FL=1